MKAPIDHVLMFVQPWVHGDELVFIVHRELKISQREAREQLQKRDRLYPAGINKPFDVSKLSNYRRGLA